MYASSSDNEGISSKESLGQNHRKSLVSNGTCRLHKLHASWDISTSPIDNRSRLCATDGFCRMCFNYYIFQCFSFSLYWYGISTNYVFVNFIFLVCFMLLTQPHARRLLTPSCYLRKAPSHSRHSKLPFTWFHLAKTLRTNWNSSVGYP